MKKTFLILLVLPSLCFSTIYGHKDDESKVRQAKHLQDKFPEAVFEIQSATDSCSAEKIKTFVDSGMLILRGVYYEYLENLLYFEGDILFKVTIAENGKIVKVGIVNSSTGNAKFDEAIKNKIATWKWNSAGDIDVAATILFKFTMLSGKKNSMWRAYIINGACPIGKVIAFLNTHYIRFRRIHIDYLKLNPDINDVKIVIKFTITGNGDITDVDIVASTTEYAEFYEAIKNKLSALKMKPIEDGNTTVITSFSFKE